MSDLNTYMGYGRALGSQEGAILIFAHTAKEARKLAYPVMHLELCDDWLDCAVRLLKNQPWLYQEADPERLALGQPHVIEFPRACRICEMWGNDDWAADGVCMQCKEIAEGLDLDELESTSQ